MARLSKIKGQIPVKYEKDCKKCFFCGNDIERGGMWAGEHHIGVCKDCTQYLIDLFADTLDDYEEMNVDDKIQYIYDITRKRILKKNNDEKVRNN